MIHPLRGEPTKSETARAKRSASSTWPKCPLFSKMTSFARTPRRSGSTRRSRACRARTRRAQRSEILLSLPSSRRIRDPARAWTSPPLRSAVRAPAYAGIRRTYCRPRTSRNQPDRIEPIHGDGDVKSEVVCWSKRSTSGVRRKIIGDRRHAFLCAPPASSTR